MNSSQTKYSIGTQTLIELISQRILIEFKNKLSKAIEKFKRKYDCYPYYIENFNDYCQERIDCIKKHGLIGVQKLTNLNQIHYFITSIYDRVIKNETDLDLMWKYYVDYDINMY